MSYGLRLFWEFQRSNLHQTWYTHHLQSGNKHCRSKILLTPIGWEGVRVSHKINDISVIVCGFNETNNDTLGAT